MLVALSLLILTSLYYIEAMYATNNVMLLWHFFQLTMFAVATVLIVTSFYIIKTYVDNNIANIKMVSNQVKVIINDFINKKYSVGYIKYNSAVKLQERLLDDCGICLCKLTDIASNSNNLEEVNTPDVEPEPEPSPEEKVPKFIADILHKFFPAPDLSELKNLSTPDFSEEIVILNCGHVFHLSCVVSYINQYGRCPFKCNST